MEVGERRAGPLVPSDLAAAADEVMAADLSYRYAVFAWDLAARCGVPGVGSPSAWEERAVAAYERLALGKNPEPAACHRLGVIYARRGYIRQAREMLTRALTRDEGAERIYWALLLLYSDKPLKAKDIPGLRGSLLRQPPWLAMWSLADLARRLNLAPLARYYEAKGMAEIRRFGWRVSLFVVAGILTVAVAFFALAIAALRSLLTPTRRPATWVPAVPYLRWVEIIDVAALAAFCNALGQVARDSLALAVPVGSEADGALRIAHAVLGTAPPLGLVIARVRRGPHRWWSALGLVTDHLGSNIFRGIVGLGLALGGVAFARDVLISLIHPLIPAAVSAQASPAPSPQNVATNVFLIVFFAPLAEEVIFRGFIFRALLNHLRPIGAVAVSAILFSISHSITDLTATFSLFFLGIVSAYMYLYSRSLVPSILLHAGYNAAILIAVAILRA